MSAGTGPGGPSAPATAAEPLRPVLRPGTLGGGGHRARLGDRLSRFDRRRHRPPVHQPLVPRRPRFAAVGRHRLLPHARCLPAPGRYARGPLRAPPHLLRRGRVVRPRLGLLRPRPRGGVAHRRPRGPGRRRGAADAGQPGHHPGVVPARGPRPRHRRLVGPRRRGGRRRAARRWLSPLRRLVALGLLHQPSPGCPGPGHHCSPRPGVTGPQRLRTRRPPGSHAGRRLPGRPHLRAHRGTVAGMVEPGRRGQPGGRRRDRPGVPRCRAPPDPPHAPPRVVPGPSVQRRQRGDIRRLRRPRRCAVPAPRRTADRGALQPARVGAGTPAGDVGHAGVLGAVGPAVGAHRARASR